MVTERQSEWSRQIRPSPLAPISEIDLPSFLLNVSSSHLPCHHRHSSLDRWSIRIGSMRRDPASRFQSSKELGGEDLLTYQWTICLSIFILLILAGVIAGAVKGSQVAKEKVVEKITSLTASATAMPATSSFTSVSSGVASVVTTTTTSGAAVGAGKPS